MGMLRKIGKHGLLCKSIKIIKKASAALSFIGGTAIRILCKVKITNSGDQKKPGHQTYANYHL